ncbi:hypothetical protein BCEP27_120089 [Burkholderia cepacia]
MRRTEAWPLTLVRYEIRVTDELLKKVDIVGRNLRRSSSGHHNAPYYFIDFVWSRHFDLDQQHRSVDRNPGPLPRIVPRTRPRLQS